MIEIVFSDSACGSLKVAQHCGEGEYQSGGVGVIITHTDGTKPLPEEIEEAKREFEEKSRLAWESARPLGGNPSDVFGFNLTLSVGDITENEPGLLRQDVFEWLCSIYPDDVRQGAVSNLMQSSKDALYSVRNRAASGEDIRIWYSDNPDEMCGLYWLMEQLVRLDTPLGQIYLVKLPDLMFDSCSDNIEKKNAWGDVAPDEWHRYISLQRTAPTRYQQACASHWRTLQIENAPLRAVLNGQLVSVPETLYDEFVTREIDAEDEEFHEAMIIGRVLGKYNFGIGDSWVALRIEDMIHAGTLEAVTDADKDMPIYHRKLKKI